MVDAATEAANLTYLLNQWDPIGVASIAPDEYRCLLSPLSSLLRRGASGAEVREFLWREMEEHFGLEPEALEIDAFAGRLVAWWAAVEADE
jgi:hypothetical protein